MPCMILEMRAKALGEAGPGKRSKEHRKERSRIVTSERDNGCLLEKLLSS